jgi:hypothetical protein
MSGNINNTYTTDCPATGDIECASQADAIGFSYSHKTLRACVLARGSTSCNTNRLASSHPTSQRDETSLVGVGCDCRSLMLTLDTSLMGRVVHDCASCADFTSIRSRDTRDCDGDGPGGRGKVEFVYKSFQSVSLQAMEWNRCETCWKRGYIVVSAEKRLGLAVRHRTTSRGSELYRILNTSSAGSMHIVVVLKMLGV